MIWTQDDEAFTICDRACGADVFDTERFQLAVGVIYCRRSAMPTASYWAVPCQTCGATGTSAATSEFFDSSADQQREAKTLPGSSLLVISSVPVRFSVVALVSPWSACTGPGLVFT